ncbi:MAG: sigma-54-dependent Fis family transcriptional regulator [Desulfobacteraceae bacterium]|nr:sigma-54-dependent Fis family transcriptional regulator [Desulfobacteraceae bacterium]
MEQKNSKEKRTPKARILIIDDDEGMTYTLQRMAQEEGHKADVASNLTQGIPLVLEGEYDVLFLDVRLPDGSGIDTIPKIQSSPFPPEIIIITAYTDKGGAQTALKSGVWDYIEKPVRINALKLSLKRALQYRSQKNTLEKPLTIERNGIIGDSFKFLMCITLMAHAAKSETNVLISGETGTGKELFAKAIHHNSARAEGPFIVVDCASLPQNLAESILFGHIRGAYTGADSDRIGLIKEADGGTLFLDEVGELPVSLQKTFLRVLQERRFRPVGSKKEVKSNFRLVSATNRDLSAEVDADNFRKDLLFRLRTFVIDLPALRERIKDIREIINYHVEKFCQKSEQSHIHISEEVFEILCEYDWPGNVRELVNTLESALALEPSCPTLYPKHLPEYIRAHSITETHQTLPKEAEKKYRVVDGMVNTSDFPTIKVYRKRASEQAEREYINELIRVTGDDIEKACQMSGLKRARLYELIKKYR